MSLDLPQTESFEYKSVQTSNEIIIISDGTIIINNISLNINDNEQIEQAIFDLENNGSFVILSADSDALHSWVITVMDLLNKFGFDEVQIRTIEK